MGFVKNTILALVVFSAYLSLKPNKVYCQFAVNNTAPNNSVQHLIENVLLGSGVTAFNFQLYGDPIQYGKFTGGGTSIGLDSGLVLSTDAISLLTIPPGIGGLIPNIPGVSGGFGPASMGTATNNDLLNVANSVPPLINQAFTVTSANDAIVMEFDFVPLSDTIEFRYVFASDEYITFVNSSYNDVFAFFLSGPGITGPYTSPPGFPGGSTNLAVVPGSNPALPISISSVNHLLNTNYYISNQPTNQNININGYTSIFTAKSAVTACDTFHIRLAIADGTDASLYSSVFLEANSFEAKGVSVVAKPNYNTIGGDSIIYEGCGGVDLTIRRSGGIQNADTAYLNIGGLALNGLDYSTLPPYLIFQPGSDSVSFSFTAINDGVLEGPEDIIISVTYNSSCNIANSDTLILEINDPLPLTNISSNDTTINCTQGPVTFNNTPNGFYPYTFIWNTGDTTSSITKDTAGTYIIKVVDACKTDSLFDTIVLNTVTPPFSTIEQSDTIFCNVDSLQIGTQVVNGYPQINYLWNNGKTDSAIWVATKRDTSLYVNVELACSGQIISDTFNIVIENPSFALTMANDTLDCTVDSIAIGPQVSGFIKGFTYLWSNGKTDSSIWVSPNQLTNYKVVVTDACGINSDSTGNTVFFQNNPMVLTTNSPIFNCVGDSVTLQVSVINGYPGFKYLWSNGATTPTTKVAPPTTSTYLVRVTDTCGIDTAIGIVEVTERNYPPLRINNMVNPELNCPGDTIVIGPATTSGGSGNAVVSWNNFLDTISTLQVSIDSTAFFIVKAIDNCNLDTARRIVTVRIAKHDPFKIITSPDTTICQTEDALLRVKPKGGAGNFKYYWSTGHVDSTVLVSPNFTSAYAVTITDDCENMVFDNIRVRVSNPKAQFNYQYIDDREIKLINLSTNDAVHFLWDFGNGDTSTLMEPDYKIDTRLTNPVKLWIENNYGCTDSAELIINNPLELYVPNSFTPNEDGLNDGYSVVTEGVNVFEIWIYDRWGNLVYNSNNPQFVWDGKNPEGRVVQGVYAYRIKAEGFNKQITEKLGTILILRN